MLNGYAAPISIDIVTGVPAEKKPDSTSAQAKQPSKAAPTTEKKKSASSAPTKDKKTQPGAPSKDIPLPDRNEAGKKRRKKKQSHDRGSDEFEEDLWVIPGVKMKGAAGKTPDFRVPLSEEAKRIITIAKDRTPNDFVFANGESFRMLNTFVSVDGHFVGNYKADGLIISTPTGSTAYSLSAGGPIITPTVDSIVITPTSAHTLTSRPLVVPGTSKITVSFSEPADSIRFVSDGQVHEILDPKTKVEILKSDYTIPLIDFNDTDYFNTLRVKMGWGKRGDQTI